MAPPGVSETFWRLLLTEPLREATVLDVGTGHGRVALALAAHCRAVVGIDVDAAAIEEARRRAEAHTVKNVRFEVADADVVDYEPFGPAAVVAHLCMSDAFATRAARALRAGQVFAFVAFHRDQWIETGRPSRFAYDEARARGLLERVGFVVEHFEVERRVTTFASVEEGLAAAIGLEERWKADGRWFRYIKFLEEGGRTLTRSHLIAKARRR